MVPFLTTALIFGVIAALNRGAATMFGLDLLLSAAVPLVLVSLGQMFVVGGSYAGLARALPLVLTVGLATGAVNAALILRLRIPAIIATLAVGYVLDTAALLANRRFTTYAVSPILRTLASAHLWGFPAILIFAGALAAGSAALIGRTRLGRTLMALGQNATAAALAGVCVSRITTIAFMLSGALAAIDGALLSAHAGGAFLGMGRPYPLQSIGAVVVGGTLIFGGSATALGTLLGSVLLVLIVTTMQIAGLPGGVQDMVQGAVIIAVLAAAGIGLSRRAV